MVDKMVSNGALVGRGANKLVSESRPNNDAYLIIHIMFDDIGDYKHPWLVSIHEKINNKQRWLCSERFSNPSYIGEYIESVIKGYFKEVV